MVRCLIGNTAEPEVARTVAMLGESPIVSTRRRGKDDCEKSSAKAERGEVNHGI